jgi:putative MATE family efflux protein
VGAAHDLGCQYLRIMAITICLKTVGLIGAACLRGAGDTISPMLVTLLIAGINVVAVPALAYGWFGLPALGIRGNALGTLIAFSISGVAIMVLLLSGWAKLRLSPRHFRIVPHVLWRVLRIGLPSWAEGMLLWIGQFVIVLLVINSNDAALAHRLGKTAAAVSGTTMAAHNAVLRIESFAFLPGFGFGIAASTLVGQYLGARRPDEARRAARIANRLAYITMTLAALAMVLVPSFLVRMVVQDENVVAVGRWPMILAGLAQPGFAVAIIMSSGLKGAGDTVWPMLATIAGMFAVRFPAVWYLARYVFPSMNHPEWGLLAVWIGIFADLNFRAVLNGAVFRWGRWQHRKV